MKKLFKEYLAWFIENEDKFSSLSSDYVYTLYLDELLDVNELHNYAFAIDPFKIKNICPHFFNVLTSSELLNANYLAINKIDSYFLKPQIIKPVYKQLYKVHECLTRLKYTKLLMQDIVIENEAKISNSCKEKHPIAIVALKNDDKSFSFIKMSLIYFLFLTDAYKYFDLENEKSN